MKFSEVLKQIRFYQRYREICVEFSNPIYGNPRPKSEELISILRETGFDGKYIAKDKIYIVKYPIDKYSLEFYFEADGTFCNIYVYAKIDKNNWPFYSSFNYLLSSCDIFEVEENNELKGFSICYSSIEELKLILQKLKPIINDLLFKIHYHLEKDDLEFDIG